MSDRGNRQNLLGVSGTRRRVTLLLLCGLFTLSYMDRRLVSTFIEPIRQSLNISDTEVSLLVGTAFALCYATAGIPMGRLADRWHRGRLIAIGVVSWSLMTGLCGLSGSFWTLFVARLGVGIGEAALSPASFSLLSDLYPRERLARVLSIYGLGIPLGTGLALLSGTLVSHEGGAQLIERYIPFPGGLEPWQLVFVILGFPGILLGALALVIIKDVVRERAGEADESDRSGFVPVGLVRHLWDHRALYMPIVIGNGCIHVFTIGATQWFPVVLQRVHGLTIQQSGLILGSAAVLLGIPGMLFAGWCADRLVSRERLDGALLVSIGYAIGMGLCGVIGPIVPDRYLSIALIASGAFFTNVTVGVIFSLVQMVAPRHMRAQVSASIILLTTLFDYVLGPSSVALVTDFVFGDPKAVGKSVAYVGAFALTVGVILQNSARKAVREHLGGFSPR
ncbi:spinster family MFS transporter [Sphingomonas sp. DT-204]|uniref:spinster family MFS transporter n=1 Tax=Sphingomonas sp. DT-204 TaxID=3396166 RepID=UPI003F1A1E96